MDILKMFLKTKRRKLPKWSEIIINSDMDYLLKQEIRQANLCHLNVDDDNNKIEVYLKAFPTRKTMFSLEFFTKSNGWDVVIHLQK